MQFVQLLQADSSPFKACIRTPPFTDALSGITSSSLSHKINFYVLSS